MTDGQNHAENEGTGSKQRKKTGNAAGVGTREVTVMGGAEGVVQGAASIQVKNLRVSRAVGASNKGMAKVSFTVFNEGTFNFQLYKSGETDQGVIGLVRRQTFSILIEF